MRVRQAFPHEVDLIMDIYREAHTDPLSDNSSDEDRDIENLSTLLMAAASPYNEDGEVVVVEDWDMATRSDKIVAYAVWNTCCMNGRSNGLDTVPEDSSSRQSRTPRHFQKTDPL